MGDVGEDFSEGRKWKMLVMLGSEGRRLLYYYYMMIEGASTVTSAGQQQERSRKTVSPKVAKCKPNGLTANSSWLK